MNDNSGTTVNYDDAIAVAGGGFGQIRIVQSRGPTLEFEGRLIAKEELRINGRPFFMEIWITKGEALIPSTRSNGFEGERDLVDAIVVEPGPDDQARRFAVMEFFEWEDRARSMVRKQLGWSLKQSVD